MNARSWGVALGVAVAIGCDHALFAQAQGQTDLLSLTSTEGQAVKAKVLEASQEQVMLQLPDRRKFNLPWSRFNEESQKLVAAALLGQCRVTAEPLIDGEYLDPGDPNEVPGTTYVRICRGASDWWARLHIGEFSEKPATFVAVEFRNGSGAKLALSLPQNCLFTGSVRGGKRWQAQEFTVTGEVLEQLRPIVAGEGLRAAGITEKGKQEELDPKSLEALCETLVLCQKAMQFGTNSAFPNTLPAFTDLSEDLFDTMPRSTNATDFKPAAFGPFRGKVLCFNRGKVQTAEGDERYVYDLAAFQPEDRAELTSRFIETNHKCSLYASGLHHMFLPAHFASFDERRYGPAMDLERSVSAWTPLVFVTVPIVQPWGEEPDRVRVYVDDEPGITLAVPADGKGQSVRPGSPPLYYRLFRAGMTQAQRDDLRQAHRIRFEVTKGQESVWSEARPLEVEQFRNTAILAELMNGLVTAKAPVRAFH